MSMHREEGPPPIAQRYRIPLRGGVIVASYLLYLVISQNETVPGIFLGLGSLLIGFAVVDRWTVWRRERSGLIQVGMTLLGAGLLGLGLYLLLR